MAYRPSAFVITVRDRSMSASLDASTETPAMAAPEASFTWPEIVLCAGAQSEKKNTRAAPATVRAAELADGIPISLERACSPSGPDFGATIFPAGGRVKGGASLGFIVCGRRLPRSKLELQVQAQHPRVQNHRGRSSRPPGHKRLHRCRERLAFHQNGAGIDHIEELHFGNQRVLFVNAKHPPRADIELRELRRETGAWGNQLDCFRALFQAGVHGRAGIRAIAVERVRGRRRDCPVYCLEALVLPGECGQG